MFHAPELVNNVPVHFEGSFRELYVNRSLKLCQQLLQNILYSQTDAFAFCRRWRKSWHKILNDPEAWEPRFKKGPDQVLLSRYVWTWGRHNSVQHDSYLCRMFPGSRPFPTKRLMETNNHVASVWKENATFIARYVRVRIRTCSIRMATTPFFVAQVSKALPASATSRLDLLLTLHTCCQNRVALVMAN